MILTAAALWACAAPETTLLKTGRVHTPAQEMTLLPVLDNRVFPGLEDTPHLDRNTPLLIPADQVMSWGEAAWRREKFGEALQPYDGPLPPGPSFAWPDFPLRGLDTDLALGLDLKATYLKETGFNSLLPAHSLADSALLPLFSATLAASNGHLDLAASFIPSATVKTTVQIDVNVLSLKGGGQVLAKTYLVDLTDPAVTESELYAGWLGSPRDGQDYGLKTAPRAVDLAFTLMARDPELALAPRFAENAWLGRVLAGNEVSNQVKNRVVDRLANAARPPAFSDAEVEILVSPYLSLGEKIGILHDLAGTPVEDAPGGAFLAAYAADPRWAAEIQGNQKLFQLQFNVLLRLAADLEKTVMARPLDPDEEALRSKVEAVLARWAGVYGANRRLRSVVANDKADWYSKKTALAVLARNLETLDNEAYLDKLKEQALLVFSDSSPEAVEAAVRRELADGGTDAEQNGADEAAFEEAVRRRIAERRAMLRRLTPADRSQAASLLAVLAGERVLTDHPVPRDVLLSALSGDDRWAAPLVEAAWNSGRYDAETIRLAGALGLDPVLEGMTSALAARAGETARPPKIAPAPRVSLLPAPRVVQEKTNGGPTPAVLIARALGGFRGRPAAIRALEEIVRRYRLGEGVTPQVAAEAVLSLGRLGATDQADNLVSLWRDDMSPDEDAALIRRAALDALAQIGRRNHWSLVAGRAESLADEAFAAPVKSRNGAGADGQAPLREAVDFLGRVRYAPAVPLLSRITHRQETTPNLRLAALGALSRIADRQAEEALRSLAGDARLDLARSAEKALEDLVKERALLRELETERL